MIVSETSVTPDSTMPRLKMAAAGMNKVDRLGWAAGFALKSYGVRIGVRANDVSALERACEYLPAGWQTSSTPLVDRVYSIMVGGTGARRFSLLYGDHLRITRSTNVEDIFDRFESDVRLFVGEFAPNRVFVHAGVVGWKGKAIVIPGRSYSGKSTLVAALVRAGATYYSDEYAVFDSKGLVHPFAKPLEIREEGEYTQARVTVGELGGKSGTKPLPVGMVLMTGYKRGATWRPRKLSPGKGVLEMLFNTVSARRSPEKAMSTLRLVTKKAEVLKGTRGDTTNVVEALLRRMDRIADRG